MHHKSAEPTVESAEKTFPFGLWLYCEMVKHNLDVIDMEIATTLSTTTFENYIKGRTTPSLDNLARILDVFGKHLEIVDNNGGKDGNRAVNAITIGL